MDGQKQWICIRILLCTRVGDTLRFSGICHHVDQVPALAKEKISAVFAAGMFDRIWLDICQRRKMDAADRGRHHGNAVPAVHRNIGKLYSMWSDPDQHRL